MEFLVIYRYNQSENPTLSLNLVKDYNRNRTLGPRKIICNAPFKHMYFKQNGKITACCASGVDAYGNIREGSILDIWNGEKANQLRKRIKNFNLSGGCSGCQHSIESKNYNAFIGRIYDSLLPSLNNKYPTEMTFEISNTCNLECVMCNGEFSNLIRRNVEKLPDLPDFYDIDFFEEIKEFLPYLKRVRFMGGEPFLIKQYGPIMDFLVKNNPACKIYIQTNGTVLNNSVKEIVESGNVEVSISIDSLQKQTYEIIRKNGSFERTMKNLNYFSERAIKHHQLININFCVMNINWREVPNIFEFCDNNNFTINLIPVEYPRHLSLRIASEEYIEEIIQLTRSLMVKINNGRLYSIYNDYINYLQVLKDQSRQNKIILQGLLSCSLEELYVKAKNLFLLINQVTTKDMDSSVFDIAYFTLNDLKEVDKKLLLSKFILEFEKIPVEEIENKSQSHEEILSKMKQIFQDIRMELADEQFNSQL